VPKREPRWVARIVVEAVHLDLVREHGGMPGLRDEGVLESALARPRQQYAYGKTPDVAGLASAYGFGLARNHPFHDGNKRIAFVTMVVFADLNGYELEATEAEVVEVMLDLAAGAVSEEQLADWVRSRLARAKR